jgi:hypothetical protein
MEREVKGLTRRQRTKYRETWIRCLGRLDPNLMGPANSLTRAWSDNWLYPHKLREAADSLRWSSDKIKDFCSSADYATPEGWCAPDRARLVEKTLRELYDNDVAPSVLHEIWHLFDLLMTDPCHACMLPDSLKPAVGYRQEWARDEGEVGPVDDWRAETVLVAIIRLKMRLPVEWDGCPADEAEAALREWVLRRSCEVNWYGMALDMLDAVGNLSLELRRVVKGLAFALLRKGLCSESYAGCNQLDRGPHWCWPNSRVVAASIILLARERVADVPWPDNYQTTLGLGIDDLIPCAKRVHARTTTLTTDVDLIASVFYGSYEWKRPKSCMPVRDDETRYKRYEYGPEDDDENRFIDDRVYGPYHE